MGSGMREGGYCPRWWNRDVVVGIWVMVSVAACAVWHFNLKMEGIARAEEVLVTMCEGRARMLQDQFAVSVNHVHALAILVSTFHYQKSPSALDQETFAYYSAKTAFERPLFSGVAYAQRVFSSERENFENQQGWTIRTMKEEPSPAQDEYAPVIFSQETVSYIGGLDMMSREEDRENILRARATGKAVLTRPFWLLGSNHLGVVLTFPVYQSGLSPDATEDERVEVQGDVVSGTSSIGMHHSGVLEGWFGEHWWSGRISVIPATTLVVFAPLVCYKRVDSLKCTSALSVGLAVVFVVITAGIAIVKLLSGSVEMPKLLPSLPDLASVWNLFTVAPVLVSAYICHYNVHTIDSELEDPSQLKPIVRTSLTLCSTVYITTSFFGFLLFGNATLHDVLANFDADLGIFSDVFSDVPLEFLVHRRP